MMYLFQANYAKSLCYMSLWCNNHGVLGGRITMIGRDAYLLSVELYLGIRSISDPRDQPDDQCKKSFTERAFCTILLLQAKNTYNLLRSTPEETAHGIKSAEQK